MLQWGRRFAATETDLPIGVAGRGVPQASMGPSLRSDGDEKMYPENGPSPMTLLQWGRRFAATETECVRLPTELRELAGFNGAVASQRRRPPITNWSQPAHSMSLQWGRRF